MDTAHSPLAAPEGGAEPRFGTLAGEEDADALGSGDEEFFAPQAGGHVSEGDEDEDEDDEEEDDEEEDDDDGGVLTPQQQPPPQRASGSRMDELLSPQTGPLHQ
jgi:hypothetical protein